MKKFFIFSAYCLTCGLLALLVPADLRYAFGFVAGFIGYPIYYKD